MPPEKCVSPPYGPHICVPPSLSYFRLRFLIFSTYCIHKRIKYASSWPLLVQFGECDNVACEPPLYSCERLQDSHYPSSTESLLEQPSGSQRVKYQGAGSHSNYDYVLDTERRSSPIDVSLVLPHYRAKNQPVDHRLGMYVGNDSNDAIKVKVVRAVVLIVVRLTDPSLLSYVVSELYAYPLDKVPLGGRIIFQRRRYNLAAIGFQRPHPPISNVQESQFLCGFHKQDHAECLRDAVTKAVCCYYQPYIEPRSSVHRHLYLRRRPSLTREVGTQPGA